MTSGRCKIDGCEVSASARGWCRKHYRKWQDYGDPEAPDRRHHGNPRGALEARVADTGGHLVWTGALTEQGYGTMWDGERIVPAHRYAWEAENGPIPRGKMVDHACHNRACVKVSHLRLASAAQNSRNRRGAQENNATGVRNVRLWRGRYRVEFQVGGKKVSGGYYDSLEEASAAAARGRALHFGAFAGNG